ncbi:hypothetical protein DL768_008698 [Monosporascus sp. mg162]|nr:hypothetical protein DL768_008698 [Monosporascus sp. mg162]
MANARFGNADRGGRQMASPRPKTRDAKDTLCRNVLIYGHCRYEDQGCAFNHEQHKNSPNSNDAPDRRLEPKATPGSGAVLPSPGIKATPCQIPSDDASVPATTSSTKVAEALSVLAEKVEADQLRFRSISERLSSLEETVDYLVSPNENAAPKKLLRNGSVRGYTNGQSANSSKKSFNVDSPSFTPAQLPGGKKSTFSTNATPFTPRGAAGSKNPHDSSRWVALTYQIAANPVLPQDTGASLFKSGQFSDFAPQNYDLNTGSAANGSTDSSSLGYDPFTMSNVGHTLPTTGYNPYAEDHTNIAAGPAPYYAAQSAYTTPLQPLNYHLYNPITPSRESLQQFQRHVQEFFVPDNTLAEHHFPSNRYGRPPHVQEKVLWSYLVQLASALKVIHNAKLAARCIDVTKVILTDKNRVRLSACAVLDVLHFETQRQVEDLQQEDFFHLGKLILGIATNTPPRNIQDVWGSLDQLGRIYSQDLKDRISWLLSPTPQTPNAALNARPKTAEQLLYDMAQHTADLLDVAFNANDENTAYLARELENGRLFRLAAKLGTINERPEFDGDPSWSETGERYTLKLFRDYVFHQVDANGNPVVDLGHIVTCLNKLDVGVDEKVYLTSRDNQTGFIVTYKELKKQIQTAFGDLLKGSSSSKQQSGGRAY